MTGGTRPPLGAALSTPESKGRYVRRLFSTIADRYDLITVLLSCGQDRLWKRRLANLADVRAGTRALDLACGTGDIAWLAAQGGARVTGLDITPRMIELARAKAPAGGAPPGFGRAAFVVGDMGVLPFPDASFDVVTTGYGLRNVPDLAGAVGEIARVLRPHGVFLSLDFNRPVPLVVRAVYLSYLTVVGSVLGWVLHRDPDPYRYIPASISRYPGAEAVARLMEARGFKTVSHYRVLGGLMAIHHALK